MKCKSSPRASTGASAKDSSPDTGLFLDAENRWVCFHCGVAVEVPSSEGSDWESRCWALHRAASPRCYLQRLAHLLLPELQSADQLAPTVASELAKFHRTLTKLREDLQNPVFDMAASFGFDRARVDFCVTRHFMHREGTVPKRPGDVIELLHKCEEEFAESNCVMEQLSIRDMLRLALDAGVPHPEPEPQQQQQAPAATSAPASGSNGAAATAPSTADDAPSPDEKCFVCRVNVRDQVTLPCAHFLLCHSCCNSARRCPKCSADIFAVVHAYVC